MTDVLDRAFVDLQEGAPLVDVEAGLRRLAELLKLEHTDSLAKAVVREATIARLQAMKVPSPAKLIDAAIGPCTTTPTNGNGSILFEDVEPWPEPAKGTEVLNAMAAAIRRYVVLDRRAAYGVSLWVMHTFLLEATDISPILAIVSATKRCGKTTLLSVLSALVPRPLPGSNISTAAVYRTVEKHMPSLLIDEADTFLKDNEELRGVLNSGHTRSTARVIRLVTAGDDFEPAAFSTWCAKAIAKIGKLPGTLEDRSIVIQLRRRAPRERVARIRSQPGLEQQLAPLRRQALRWALDNLEALRRSEPWVPPGLNDRAGDSWRPLLAIADRAGGRWPSRARKAAEVLSGEVDEAEGAPGVQALHDLEEIFTDRGVDRLPTEDIITTMVGMENRPWPEWRQGKPVTSRQLARLLKPFGVSSVKFRTGFKTLWGYTLESLRDPLTRYSPPIPAVYPEHSRKTLDRKGFRVPDVPERSPAVPDDPEHANIQASIGYGNVPDVPDDSGGQGPPPPSATPRRASDDWKPGEVLPDGCIVESNDGVPVRVRPRQPDPRPRTVL